MSIDVKQEDSNFQNGMDRFSRQQKEDEYWQKRRERRERYAARGADEVWGQSPSRSELREIYEEHEKAAKKSAKEAKKAEKTERKRLKDAKKHAKKELKRSRSNSLSSSSDKPAKKTKQEEVDEERMDIKSKKKHKKRLSASSDEEVMDEPGTKIKKEENVDNWVELTSEIREKEAQKIREEEARIIGPQIPEALLASSKDDPSSSFFDGKVDAEGRKNMLRGEAAAMAAYAAQGKRIPRRGEIGLSSDEISTFEKVGYIMSGTRHKSMEATRLRKENQILTAEEKRLLSGFTYEQRKQKEDLVMKQFESLVASKRGN